MAQSEMRVWRETNAIRINEMLNDPVVRPDVANKHDGVLDITKAIESPLTHCLMGEHGCILFVGYGGGIYEVHSQVLWPGRGTWFNQFSHLCATWMYTKTDCWELLTRVPRGHFAARAAAIAAGFKFQFTRPNECVWRDKQCDVDIYSLGPCDWIERAEDMKARGAWLHQRMHNEAQRLGITQEPHPDDPNHNYYAGGALEMIANGQGVKGIAFYNRWALICRHATIALLAMEPPTVRFDIGVMRWTGNDIEVSLT